MIYKAKKQVFNYKGCEVATSYFDVPCSFVEQLVQLLIDENYTLFDNEDNYKMLSKVFTRHDKPFYTRIQFRKVNHG